MTVSASQSRRWLTCELATRLPQRDDMPGPSAIVGTRFHGLVESGIKALQSGHPPPTLDTLDETFEKPLRAVLNWFSSAVDEPATVLLEQAYRLEGETATRIATQGHRDYHGSESAVYGTADVVVLEKGTIAHVIDWKTGKKSDDHEPQLATLAVMAALAESVPQVRTSAVYVSLASGKISVVTKLHDQFDLHVHAGAIENFNEQRRLPVLPLPVPGKHCFYCLAIGCPEKNNGPE